MPLPLLVFFEGCSLKRDDSNGLATLGIGNTTFPTDAGLPSKTG